MEQGSYRHHFFIILLLVLFGFLLRLVLFSGFVLGDDPAYADLVSQIIKGSYPQIGTRGVFACRPLILYPIALSIYLFGWFEWSFVLTIFIASLINIVLVYLAGTVLWNPRAGVLGALAYMTFPLDAVHATTLSNDILLSTVLWSGGLLFLLSCRHCQDKKYVYLSLVSGFITGAAVAVKFNALVAPVLFLSIGFVGLWKQLSKGAYKTLVAWSIGWIAANGLLCIFLYALSGDFLAHYHAEMRFNLDYNPSGFTAGGERLIQFLLLYPRWILTLLREGHHGYTFPPYGYFYLIYIICLPLVLLNRFKAIRLPALCALFYLLVMEFAPLRLVPHYVPIHRLPRFLHIAAIPSAVVIGVACAVLTTMRNWCIKFIFWTIFAILISSSIYWSCIKASFYKDCALDQRWAWDKVKDIAANKIITDIEMRNYLMFRSGFNPKIPIEYSEKMPEVQPPGSVVIFGGARRPEIYPSYTLDWGKKRQRNSWLLIADAPFALKPWRLLKLQIYRINDNSDDATEGEDSAHENQQLHTSKSFYHEPITGMKKISELDVGNSDSEKECNYQIIEPTWFGERDFLYADGTQCEDDGRAYRGKELITLKNLNKNRALHILKRLDPTVKKQNVDVYYKNEFIGSWHFDVQGKDFQWQESVFIIPAKYVTDTSGTLEFRFQKSDSDINSFYYWFFQQE